MLAKVAIHNGVKLWSIFLTIKWSRKQDCMLSIITNLSITTNKLKSTKSLHLIEFNIRIIYISKFSQYNNLNSYNIKITSGQDDFEANP